MLLRGLKLPLPVRVAIGWVLLTVGLCGSALSLLGVIGKSEPQLVLQLSWWALIYEGFNAVQIAQDAG